MMTVEALRDILKDVPADYEIKMGVPCRFMHDGIYVEKSAWQAKVSINRKMVVLDTEAIEFGPR